MRHILYFMYSKNYADNLFKNKKSLEHETFVFYFHSKLGHPDLGAQPTRVGTLHMHL
jgi:hypothetical protein